MSEFRIDMTARVTLAIAAPSPEAALAAARSMRDRPIIELPPGVIAVSCHLLDPVAAEIGFFSTEKDLPYDQITPSCTRARDRNGGK